MKLALVLAAALVIFSLAPTVAAEDNDPCICPPDPCGPAPSIRDDPHGWLGWELCHVLGGHPW